MAHHRATAPLGSDRPVLRSIEDAVDLIAESAVGRPLLLVGLAGAPGAGTSSAAAELVARIPEAVLLPLDGYHLPQAELRGLGRRKRRGAPDAVDVQAFVSLLRMLRGARAGDILLAPSFDPSIGEPVPDAPELVVGDRTVVVVEGDHLLSDEDGWAEVAPLLDLRLHLRLDPMVRRRRLVARHLRFGMSLDEALARADGPDEASARRIEAAAGLADAILEPASAAPLRILHLSDTHLLARSSDRYNRIVDPRAALDAVLDAHSRVPSIDAVVVSGDLADDGDPASYRHLRERLSEWCAARGAVPVLALGNHDDRSGFGAGGPWNTVTELRGVRVLVLDSSVPGGTSWGLLTESTLRWLRERLAEEPTRPSIIVLHHPPIEAVTPLHRGMGLINPHDFWEAVSGSPVLAVLAGHWHHAFVDTTTPAPVVVAPGGANRTDVLAGPLHERSVAASGAAIVEVHAGGVRVTATEVPAPHRGAELFDVSGDVLDDWQRRLGFPG